MLCTGWRTLVAEKPSDFSLRDNCIRITGDNECTYPINQVRNIVITSPYGTISLPLLNELSKNSVNVLICDRTRTPASEIVNIGNQSNVASAIIRQSQWDKERKGLLWQHIVKNKIKMQRDLLVRLENPVPEYLNHCLEDVQLNDATNREGMAAKVYFPALFGNGFRRMAPDAINAGLNYGYTVVRTSLDRIITSYGYHTALGINHCSVNNRFNLSCDIMEPFRPFVDEVVSMQNQRILDSDYKSILVNLLKMTCNYKGNEYSIEYAMEQYARDCIVYLNEGKRNVGEVCFHRQKRGYDTVF